MRDHLLCIGGERVAAAFGLSGIGRENGMEAIRRVTETTSIWVELTGSTRDPFVLG